MSYVKRLWLVASIMSTVAVSNESPTELHYSFNGRSAGSPLSGYFSLSLERGVLQVGHYRKNTMGFSSSSNSYYSEVPTKTPLFYLEIEDVGSFVLNPDSLREKPVNYFSLGSEVSKIKITPLIPVSVKIDLESSDDIFLEGLPAEEDFKMNEDHLSSFKGPVLHNGSKTEYNGDVLPSDKANEWLDKKHDIVKIPYWHHDDSTHINRSLGEFRLELKGNKLTVEHFANGGRFGFGKDQLNPNPAPTPVKLVIKVENNQYLLSEKDLMRREKSSFLIPELLDSVMVYILDETKAAVNFAYNGLTLTNQHDITDQHKTSEFSSTFFVSPTVNQRMTLMAIENQTNTPNHDTATKLEYEYLHNSGKNQKTIGYFEVSYLNSGKFQVAHFSKNALNMRHPGEAIPEFDLKLRVLFRNTKININIPASAFTKEEHTITIPTGVNMDLGGPIHLSVAPGHPALFSNINATLSAANNCKGIFSKKSEGLK